MKKKYLLVLGLLALSLAVGGCGKKDDTAQASSSVVSSGAESEADTGALSQVEVPADYVAPATMEELMGDLDLDKLVTLGEYKGLTLTKDIVEVTDADVENAVAEALKNTYVEVDRAAENGDTVNIDYVGTMDGEEFEGGSATGYNLQLGSDSFIDGFEDGLVGAKKGDVVTLDLTFPKSYTEELSGKAVQFKVTINKVQTTSKEISEEWVKANSDFESIEDYRRELRVQLETRNDADAENTMESEAWKTVLENSVVNDYPEKVVQYGRYFYDQMLKSTCEQNGITIEDYMDAKGITTADYEKLQSAYAQSLAGQLLVMAAIEKAEGISAADQEYQDSLNEIITASGVNEETFFSYYDRFSVEQSVMLERINKIIVENATVTEKMVETGETEEKSESTASEAGNSQTSETEGSQAPEAEETSGTETSIVKEVLEPIE